MEAYLNNLLGTIRSNIWFLLKHTLHWKVTVEMSKLKLGRFLS